MDHIGIDVHKRESQIYVLAETGEVIERRIRTEPERFAAVLGPWPPARVLIEASTESEWVARCLERLGHEVIVGDPNDPRGAGARHHIVGRLTAGVCQRSMPLTSGGWPARAGGWSRALCLRLPRESSVRTWGGRQGSAHAVGERAGGGVDAAYAPFRGSRTGRPSSAPGVPDPVVVESAGIRSTEPGRSPRRRGSRLDSAGRRGTGPAT